MNIAINTLSECDSGEPVYYEEIQEKVVNFESKFNDFNSLASNIEYNELTVVELDGFTDTENYTLKKVEVNVSLEGACSFTAKNFASNIGNLNLNYSKQVSLSSSVVSDLDFTLASTKSFLNLSTSTIDQYTDFKLNGTNASSFPTDSCSTSTSNTYTFEDEADLNKFITSKISFDYINQNLTTVVNTNDSISVDGSFTSQATIKIIYYYDDN